MSRNDAFDEGAGKSRERNVVKPRSLAERMPMLFDPQYDASEEHQNYKADATSRDVSTPHVSNDLSTDPVIRRHQEHIGAIRAFAASRGQELTEDQQNRIDSHQEIVEELTRWDAGGSNES